MILASNLIPKFCKRQQLCLEPMYFNKYKKYINILMPLREDVSHAPASHFRRCASRSRHPAGSAAPPPRRECRPSTPQHNTTTAAAQDGKAGKTHVLLVTDSQEQDRRSESFEESA